MDQPFCHAMVIGKGTGSDCLALCVFHRVKKVLRQTRGQFNLPLLLDEGEHLLVCCRQTGRILHQEIGKLTCGGKRFCEFHRGTHIFLVKRPQFCSPLLVCWESLRFGLLPVILKLAHFVDCVLGSTLPPPTCSRFPGRRAGARRSG